MQVGGVARVETLSSHVQQTPKIDRRSGFIKIEEHGKIWNWNRALMRETRASREKEIVVYSLILHWLGTRLALNYPRKELRKTLNLREEITLKIISSN